MKTNQDEMLLNSEIAKAGNNTETFTCTMHPKVKSDKPGKYLKCEMELENKN